MKVDSKKAKLMAMAMATAATAALAWTGCDSHEEGGHGSADGGGGHTSPYPSCNEVVEACHEVDTGEGEIHDCHDTAHGAKADSDCAGTKARCLEICAAAKADAGADHDGG
ncbi:MAG: hypothetical protein KF764_30600 [Labilithrix sp.]|nr:hypothetical protein [Labilithrix sp.]MBX3220133.1 hypothetical protein [Labilithrix sp.]